MGASDASAYDLEGLWGDDAITSPEAERARVSAIVTLIPGEARHILDVGAGDGRVTHAVASATGAATVAVDRSAIALGHVTLPSVRASGGELPVRDHAVDLVLCTEMLEHLPVVTYDRARGELARVARRWILIGVPNRIGRTGSAQRFAAASAAAGTVPSDTSARFAAWT